MHFLINIGYDRFFLAIFNRLGRVFLGASFESDIRQIKRWKLLLLGMLTSVVGVAIIATVCAGIYMGWRHFRGTPVADVVVS